MAEKWQVDITLTIEGDRTAADAVLSGHEGAKARGSGSARRNPADPAVVTIGEELAAARALSALAHDLLDTAARHVEESTHEPGRIVR